MPRLKSSPETREEGPRFSGGDIGVHLLVCMAVGCGLGYALDKWLGWTPWAMMAGGALGFGAWLRTVWKVFKGLGTRS